jgi:hypothetical protein
MMLRLTPDEMLEALEDVRTLSEYGYLVEYLTLTKYASCTDIVFCCLKVEGSLRGLHVEVQKSFESFGVREEFAVTYHVKTVLFPSLDEGSSLFYRVFNSWQELRSYMEDVLA